MSDAPFTITTLGHLTAEGAWAIEAKIEFRDDEPSSDVLHQASLALRDAVDAEAERGKILRAARTC